MIHQGSVGFRGNVPDVEIAARETLDLTTKLTQILADHTGQTFERVKADTQRDFFLNAEAAKEYGLIDEVIVKSTPLGSSNGSSGL
jgi:ATP-dependent Clp protease protease subunit